MSIYPVLRNLSAEQERAIAIALKRGDYGLVTFDMLMYFLLVNNWGIGQCVTIMGLGTNLLNIITFVRQGLRDTVNISLLGLTVSDLGSLVFLFFINICWTPAIMKMDLPFYPEQMMYFLFWGHVIFTRVTTGTTAWIAFERCLCIAAPLKVKEIITPRRTIIYIFVLYATMMATIAPMFYTSRLAWIFDKSKNKSLLGYIKIKNRNGIEDLVYLINNFLPAIFFVLIVICTLVLIKTLRKNARWREQTTALTRSSAISNRDTKVVKMVVIISTVFICCYAPGAVFFVWLVADPEMKIDGRQKNLMLAVFSILLHLEGINATVNFFVYAKMSSKFNITFQQICYFCSKDRNEQDV